MISDLTIAALIPATVCGCRFMQQVTSTDILGSGASGGPFFCSPFLSLGGFY
jgi:hypothetical protein